MGNFIAPAECAVLLAGSVLTGLWVLWLVFAGWRRGRHSLLRPGVLAAALLGALDVVVPAGLVTLLWLLVRSLRDHPLMF